MKKWFDETIRKSDVLSKSQKIMMIGRSTLDEVSNKSSKDKYLYFNAKCTGKYYRMIIFIIYLSYLCSKRK